MSNPSLKEKALEVLRALRASLVPAAEPKRLPPPRSPRLPIRLVSRARYRVSRDAGSTA
jgi:hypothetical protein